MDVDDPPITEEISKAVFEIWLQSIYADVNLVSYLYSLYAVPQHNCMSARHDLWDIQAFLYLVFFYSHKIAELENIRQ